MSSWYQTNRGENLVWFGEIERKLAVTVLPLNYFMVYHLPKLAGGVSKI